MILLKLSRPDLLRRFIQNYEWDSFKAVAFEGLLGHSSTKSNELNKLMESAFMCHAR